MSNPDSTDPTPGPEGSARPGQGPQASWNDAPFFSYGQDQPSPYAGGMPPQPGQPPAYPVPTQAAPTPYAPPTYEPPAGAPYPPAAFAPQPPYAGQQPYASHMPGPGEQSYVGQPYPGQLPYSAQPYPMQVPGPAAAPWTPPANGAPAAVASPGAERVGRGLAAAILGIVAGLILTIVVWQFGFVASITTFVMAWLTVWLYSRAAGSPPKRGIPGLIALIVVGVLLCAVGVIASDAMSTFSAQAPDLPFGTLLRISIQAALDPSVWSAYGGYLLMFLLFAALGVYSTLRTLGRTRRSRS